VRIAFLLLLGLIGISPVLLIVDGPLIHALLVAYAAAMVALVGSSIRPAEEKHLASLVRPIAIIAVIPAVWMLIQMLPLPIKSLSHPIWASAETALGVPIMGSITIDPGATLVALCYYFAVVGILFVATAVTIDRARAESVLFWLVGVTTFAAAVRIVHGVGGFTFLGESTDTGTSASITALCALGVILTAAAAIWAIERYETRRTETEVSFAKFAIILSTCLVAFAICSLALVCFATSPIIFAAACGLTTLVIVMVIRRLGLGGWAGSAMAATAAGAAIAIAKTHAVSGDLTLRFALDSPTSLVPIAQRIIRDTGWRGTGAGTFASLLPIYGNVEHVITGVPAPTTAAGIAIELGQPALWAILIMVIICLMLLVRGALQRGRDAFYPAAAASCVVVSTLEAFCDAGLVDTAVIISATAVLGLGLAQSASRTSQ
jgi:hypothetical protein